MKKSHYTTTIKALFILLNLSTYILGFSQSNRPKTKSDTVFITYYGKDVPTSNYNATSKVEEGMLVKGKKEAIWIKYYPDGRTPRLKGNYIADEPNGYYEKFYPTGVIKEKGVFFNHHYTDTITYYFANGKISSISIYNKQGKQIGTARHYYNTGDLALTYEIKENKVQGEVTWYAKSGEISSQIIVKNKGQIKPIYHNEVAFNANMPKVTSGFNAIRVAAPVLKDGAFDPNGYNIIYNSQDEIYQVGTFKFGTIYNGKIYNYDNNGILKSISIYRDGFYFSEGTIQ